MKKIAFLVSLCVLLLGAEQGFAATQHDMQGMQGQKGTKLAAKPAYSDQAFLSGMIGHHEGAVDMAEMFLKMPAEDLAPQVREWAEQIKNEQRKEIALMQDMLQKLGGMDKAAYTHMKSAMAENMSNREHNGAMDVCFVQEMLSHHADALEMSVPALLRSTDKNIVQLAQEIIAGQSKEILEFRHWLAAQKA